MEEKSASHMDHQSDWQSGHTLAETNLYMFDHQVACDVHFLCGEGGTKVSAHKYMLISRSSVFYTMFYGALTETGDNIAIPDIDADIMTAFLRYLYTEYVDILPDNVMTLMYAAKKYSIQSLVEQCSSFLKDRTSAEDLCSILEQAHLFDEKDLQEQCFERILSKNSEILNEQNTDILNLCADCLKRLIKSDKLLVQEEVLFSLCLKWSAEQCRRKGKPVMDENQREVLGDILFSIRFPNMSPKYFTEYVSNRNILTAEEKIVLFQYFNRSKYSKQEAGVGKSLDTGSRQFSARPRKNTDIYKINRFTEILGGTFDFWVNENSVDAISFSCSQDINLIGISVFAPFNGGIIRGSVKLYDESFWCMTGRDKVKIKGDENKKLFDITFPTIIKLEQGKWYTIAQRMSGGKSYLGKNGLREVEGRAGAIFYFRKSPMDDNNTSVDSGQIHAILYN